MANLRRSGDSYRRLEIYTEVPRTTTVPLKEITNRDHTRRLMQCPDMSIWPLGMEELSDFFSKLTMTMFPNSTPNWRREDQEQALLNTCFSYNLHVSLYECFAPARRSC